MTFTAPTIITDDLLAALDDAAAESYLNCRTGVIVRLYPDDRWKEDDDAHDARAEIEARPDRWLRLPHAELPEVANWLIRHGVHPTLA